MRILLSNDDGVAAPGLIALHATLSRLGTVTVVAPDGDRSGFSSAITLDRPLRPIQLDNGFWAVNGTPADCVYLALNGLFHHLEQDTLKKPAQNSLDNHSFTLNTVPLRQHSLFDLVVTGINSGANLGDDTLYSGTVGAAFEGRIMHKPSIAVSLAGPHVRGYNDSRFYQAAAEWIYGFIAKGLPSLPPHHILNINLPDIGHLNASTPAVITRLGSRVAPNPIQAMTDPRGRTVYWIGLAGEPETLAHHRPLAHIPTDFGAIENGLVSITPIQMDATNYAVIEQLMQHLI